MTVWPQIWPLGLRGQLMGAIALALIVAQVSAFALFARERSQAVRLSYRENVIVRTESLLRSLNDAPTAQHARILTTASSRALRFSVDPQPAVGESDTDRRAGRMAADLAARLDLPENNVRIAFVEGDDPPLSWHHSMVEHMGNRDEADDSDGEDAKDRPWRRARWIALSLARPDGSWLNAVVATPPRAPPFGATFLASLLLSLAAVLLAAYWLARRLTQPILALAGSARDFGRGNDVRPLSPQGPREVRQTIEAFNDMQTRIDHSIKERTQMLAAVSHDLRTPLTSLRLRAELVDDQETRARLTETIGEMQRITNDTLDFLRAEQSSEAARDTDLGALAHSIADDMEERGHPIQIADAPRIVVRCPPVALRRALRNLMENAAIYGKQAVLRLERGPDQVRLLIEDQGPGLPQADLERMFTPFARGEESRSRETGGLGMGLPIARTILRRLGGDVVLQNRENGGLRATVSLPAPST